MLPAAGSSRTLAARARLVHGRLSAPAQRVQLPPTCGKRRRHVAAQSRVLLLARAARHSNSTAASPAPRRRFVLFCCCRLSQELPSYVATQIRLDMAHCSQVHSSSRSHSLFHAAHSAGAVFLHGHQDAHRHGGRPVGARRAAAHQLQHLIPAGELSGCLLAAGRRQRRMGAARWPGVLLECAALRAHMCLRAPWFDLPLFWAPPALCCSCPASLPPLMCRMRWAWCVRAG